MLHAIDFYKVGHVYQYPKGTEKIYANFTARSSKHAPFLTEQRTIFFGLQAVINDMVELWDKEFFKKDIVDIITQYSQLNKECLGFTDSYEHIKKLHALGYLPLEIRALPEGSEVGIKVPYLTITNTHKDHAWLVNYIESWISSALWPIITSATISYEFRKLFEEYAKSTCDNNGHVPFQGHDFSFRGLTSMESCKRTGAGHLLNFLGTDSVPAIDYLAKNYGDRYADGIGFSVPATEHSVMCAHGKDNEADTYRKLITEIYPSGIVSIVSDTWDLWNVVDNILPSLKAEIKARDGKVVIRPDSGDPVEIVPKVVSMLAKNFGYTVNSKGYKELDPSVGVIYGDSINLTNAKQILDKLKEMGFASSNIVFGIGSFQYQYNTRDTFGLAMKTTLCTINGEDVPIFKDPITDDGMKKSAKGYVKVEDSEDGKYHYFKDGVSGAESMTGALKLVYSDGRYQGPHLTTIRGRLWK